MSEETQEVQANTPQDVSLNVQDIINVVKIIDVVTDRGAIKGDELSSVGAVRDKLVAFVNANAPQPPAEEETESGDSEEVVDGLIDLCVFAIGTLDVFGVDANKAWDAVYKANISKEPGIKPGRPNPFGLPDLLKPEDWQAPSHEDNHGDFSNAL